MAGFNWGGQTWAPGQQNAFATWLASRGANYNSWAALHPGAAATLKGNPASATDPFANLALQSLQPELDLIKQQQAEQDAQYKAKLEANQGFTEALAKLLGSVGPSIAGIYSGAAGEQAGLAKGLSGKAGADASAEAQQQGDYLKNIVGAPASQGSQLAGQIGDGGANVLYGLGGFIPGQALGQEGAAWGSYGAMAPSWAALQGLENVRQIQGDQATSDQSFTDQMNKALADLPSIASDLRSKDAATKLAQAKYNASLNKVDAGLSKQAGYFVHSDMSPVLDKKGHLIPVNTSSTVRLQRFTDGNGVVYTFNPSTGEIRSVGQVAVKTAAGATGTWKTFKGADGNTYAINSKTGEQHVVVQGNGPARVPGSLTQEASVKMGALASQIAQSAYYGVKDAAGKWQLGKRSGKPLVPISYQAALTEMKQEGVDLPHAEAELNKLYGRGKRGRPWLDQLERDALVQKGLATRQQANAAMNKASLAMPLLRKLQRAGGVGSPLAGSQPDTAGAATMEGKNVILLAQRYLGTPYVYGGASPKTGFDCSGFAQWLYGQVGVKIPRTSQEQWQAGRAVAPGDLMAGDVVFFVGSDGTSSAPGHEGLYIGNGQFIESPHTGAKIRISSLAGRKDFVGARRFA